MLDSILNLDHELFLYLNNLGNESWDWVWMYYTDKKNWIPLYLILLYLMYKRLNTKMFVLTIIVFILMVLITDHVTNLFKQILFKRLRPCHNEAIMNSMRLVKSWCGGKFGYFSGHSSNAMAIAVFSSLILRARYKYIPIFLIMWALIMGYSRIYLGVHFPLDVITGFIFGGLLGYLFYKLDKYLQLRFIYNKSSPQ